jgi:hypothetical protein
MAARRSWGFSPRPGSGLPRQRYLRELNPGDEHHGEGDLPEGPEFAGGRSWVEPLDLHAQLERAHL